MNCESTVYIHQLCIIYFYVSFISNVFISNVLPPLSASALYEHALNEQQEEVEDLRREEHLCLPSDLDYNRYTLRMFIVKR